MKISSKITAIAAAFGIPSGGISSRKGNKYKRHQGKKEMERRRKAMEKRGDC